MNPNTERELKLFLSQEEYEKLSKAFPWQKTILQSNTYYDDDQETLKKAGAAFRIRTIGNQHLFTLKIRQDAITKAEYEYSTNASRPDELTKEEWSFIESKFPVPKDLHPTVTIQTKRMLYSFEDAELCLDESHIDGITDYEIEYEYHTDHNGIQKFNEMLAPYGLQYTENGPSKLTRAMMYKASNAKR